MQVAAIAWDDGDSGGDQLFAFAAILSADFSFVFATLSAFVFAAFFAGFTGIDGERQSCESESGDGQFKGLHNYILFVVCFEIAIFHDNKFLDERPANMMQRWSLGQGTCISLKQA